MLTSLYLCGHTVQAAVGCAARRGARVTAFRQEELPEGCLVNSVPVDEGALAGFLRGFFRRHGLPARQTALVLGDASFQYSRLTLPALHGRTRQRLLQRELESEAAADTLLTDTMALYAGKEGETLLVTRVERALVGRWVGLCSDAGLHLVCIDGTLPCLIRAAGYLPALQGPDTLLLQVEDGSFTLLQLQRGRCLASVVERLRCRRGTPEGCRELARGLTHALLCLLPSPEGPPGQLYLAGCHTAEAAACRTACAELGMEALPLPDAPAMALPKGVRLADALPVVGNLVAW